MSNPDRGVRVFAINNEKVHSKFDIYLEFSGQREWLMMYRHNGIIFNTLKDGISLADLRRLKGRDRDKFKHIIRVIDEYIKYERGA